MTMCQCKSLPDGSTIVCDTCASQIVTMLNEVVPDQAAYATGLPQAFTQVEYAGMMAAVNLWLDDLSDAQQREVQR
jgi:hypothetical protein